jgi:uncharacterized protein (TIGR02466 family)
MNIIINEWWTTPVWEVQTDFTTDFNDRLLDEIDKYKPSNVNEYNLWQIESECISKLKDFTKKIVKELTYEYIYPTLGDFEYWHTRGWINHNKPGQSMAIHGHGGPKIAMTYYIKAPENCGDLLVIDPRNGCDWDSGMDGVNGSKFKRVKPAESKLVFFPGFLLHSVEENKSKYDRISLTSNMGTFDKATFETAKKLFGNI